MLKRRRATAVSSSAVASTAVATPTQNEETTQIFENNLKFIAQSHEQRRHAPPSLTGTKSSLSTGAPSNSSSASSSIAYLSAAATATGEKVPMLRTAAGKKWVDNKLAEFDPESNFCIFVGDLGNECTDEHLIAAFSRYPSFQRARVVIDQLTQKNKGYGFVAFKNAEDYLAAMREMNGKYVGNRPVKLRKGTWEKRADAAGLAKLAKKVAYDKKHQQK